MSTQSAETAHSCWLRWGSADHDLFLVRLKWPAAGRCVVRVEAPFRGELLLCRLESVESAAVVAVPEEELERFGVMSYIEEVVHEVA